MIDAEKRQLMSPQEHQNKAPLLAKQGQLTDIPTTQDVPTQKASTTAEKPEKIDVDLPSTLINRELSWLSFARRVLALAENPNLPLLERVKFAGIMGMLYDEFAMKRMGGLKRKIEKTKRIRNCLLMGSAPKRNYRPAGMNCINRLASFLVW